MNKEVLLNTEQMAKFVANGFLEESMEGIFESLRNR